MFEDRPTIRARSKAVGFIDEVVGCGVVKFVCGWEC